MAIFELDQIFSIRNELVLSGDKKALAKLDLWIRELAHPAEAHGIVVPKFNSVKGGGGNITQPGRAGAIQIATSAVGNTATFSIQGQTTVEFDMYMFMGQIPCGIWVYGGPGSFQQRLGGNAFECSPAAGQICYISACQVTGPLPVYVTSNG